MNIHHFESHIDKTILSRGYSYYVEGHVVDAYEQGENEYIFDIIGSEDYEVLVEIEDSGDIIYSECDCPYVSDLYVNMRWQPILNYLKC